MTPFAFVGQMALSYENLPFQIVPIPPGMENRGSIAPHHQAR